VGIRDKKNGGLLIAKKGPKNPVRMGTQISNVGDEPAISQARLETSEKKQAILFCWIAPKLGMFV
jgi:hypothetical protein